MCRFYLVSLGAVSSQLEELEGHLGEVGSPVSYRVGQFLIDSYIALRTT